MSAVYGSKRIKSALGYFLAGKILSGGLGLFVLIWLVRMLTAEDYGAYVSLVAFQTIALMASSLGIESTIERFLPEVRVKQGKVKALILIIFGGMARLITLCVAGGLIYFFSGWICIHLKIPHMQDMVRLFAFSFLFNGVVAALLVFLDAMLMQKWSQFVAISSALVKVIYLCVSAIDGHLTLRNVLLADLCAAIAGGVIALISFYRWGGHAIASAPEGGQSDNLRLRMARFSIFNYFAQVIMAAYSQDTIKLIIIKSINVLASAKYGFVSNIVELVQRYLPAMLLIRLIRPVFVSKYAVSKDFQQLNTMANVVLKINLMFLLPAIVFVLVYGKQFVALLSNGKYSDTNLLLAAVLVVLIPSTHQWVLSIVASTLERNELQLKSALIAVFMLPVAILAIPQLGLYGAVLSIYLSSILYNAYAVYYLRRMGYAYHQDWSGIFRALACAIVTGVLFSLIPGGANGWLGVMVAALSVFCMFLALAAWLKPFSMHERMLINKILPKPIFVF